MPIDDELLEPWTKEPTPVSERTFTPWCDQRWMAWNQHAVEVQVAQFLQLLAQELRSQIKNPYIIETGVGQGFVTRRIHDNALHYRGWESDDDWRAAVSKLLEDEPMLYVDPIDKTPKHEEIMDADLMILDSNDPFRTMEFFSWLSIGKEHSLVFVHDTGNQHPSWDGHFTLGQVIRSSKVSGFWCDNPRGAFIACRSKLEVPRWVVQLWRSVRPQ